MPPWLAQPGRGLAECPGLSGIAAAVWVRAQQVWVSQRPGQDVHIGPHGPPSRLCVHRVLLTFMSLAQRRWEPGTF